MNAQNHNTVVHKVAWNGDLNIASYLLEVGADPQAQDDVSQK